MSNLIGATNRKEIVKLADTHGAETAETATCSADYSNKCDMFNKPVSRVLFEEPGGTILFLLKYFNVLQSNLLFLLFYKKFSLMGWVGDLQR